MKILVLGCPEEAHARHMGQALGAAGASVNYLDTTQFPARLRLSWCPQTAEGTLRFESGDRLSLGDIHSVFWRSLGEPAIAPLEPPLKQVAIQDAASLLRSLIKSCPARWVNSWQAYEFHKEKPRQLQRVHELGVTIPDTLISNDPEEVQAFAEGRDRLIFKPVYGGAHTRILTREHLDTARLQHVLSLAPVTLQTYIPGTNLRTYVIEDAVYAAEIRSASLDFREDAQAQLIPVVLPETAQRQCVAIARALGLTWTAIDWRQPPDDEWVFLEANPSPMFLFFEQQTGYPITQALVETLTR